MVLAYLPLLLKSYSLSDMEIGTVIGVYSLSSMALMLPMGVFSDFFSPKRTMIIGAVLFTAYFFSLILVKTFWLLLPVVVMGGLGTAALMVVSESLYLKLFGMEKRGVRVAIYQLGIYLGYGLGPLTGGYLMAESPLSVFRLAAAGGMLVLALSFFLSDTKPLVFSFRKYGADILKPKPLFLIACIFVLGTHFGVEQTSFTLFMQKDLGFSPDSIGWIFAALGVWMAFLAPFIGKLHDKRRSVFVFFLGGLLISGIFQILTPWSQGFGSLLLIRLIHTSGDALALLELGVLPAILFPAERLGGNSGLLYSVRTLATFLAAVASGGINGVWGYGASFVANGAMVILFVMAGAILVKKMIRD
jgi:MFS family permease